ncbi:MAG: M56 family metallopeptidase [bacterium]|nr:MAG: M56 family metallopeptidase [bacterium]
MGSETTLGLDLAPLFFKLFVDVFLKSIALLILVGLVVKLLRNRPATFHYYLLIFSMIGLLVLPVLSVTTPLWQIPLLNESLVGGAVVFQDGVSYLASDRSLNEAEPSGPEGIKGDQKEKPATPGERTAPAKENINNQDEINSFRVLSAREPGSWLAWIMWVWVTGVLFCIGWLLVNWIGLWLIQRESEQLVGNYWDEVLVGIREVLGTKRQVRLFKSTRIGMAISFGVFHPTVILPEGATKWPEEQTRMVLLHELVHVRRWDVLVDILARLTLAIHWFNPLVWLALRQLQIERERACDNVVLNSGIKPSDYAEQLITTAAELGAFHKPWWQKAAASEGSSLKDRLLCILDPNIKRGTDHLRSSLATGLVAALVVISLSAGTIWVETPLRAKTEGDLLSGEGIPVGLEDKTISTKENEEMTHKRRTVLKSWTIDELVEFVEQDGYPVAFRVELGSLPDSRAGEVAYRIFKVMKKHSRRSFRKRKMEETIKLVQGADNSRTLLVDLSGVPLKKIRKLRGEIFGIVRSEEIILRSMIQRNPD